jgi:hypothetical protein
MSDPSSRHLRMVPTRRPPVPPPDDQVAVHRLLEAASAAVEQLPDGPARNGLLLAMRAVCDVLLDVHDVEVPARQEPPAASPMLVLSDREWAVLLLMTGPLNIRVKRPRFSAAPMRVAALG